MNSKYAWLLAAAVVLTGNYNLRAQMTDPSADAKDEAKPAEVANKDAEAPKESRPKMADLISPEAANKLDEGDLTEKLTGRKKGNDADPMVKLDQIMSRMGQVSDLLVKEKDTGLMTQEAESRIIVDIDGIIEFLKKQESQSQSQSQSESKGQQKQESKTSSMGAQQQNSGQSAKESQLPSGGIEAAKSNNTELHDNRFQWGTLPPKDRDLVTDGSRETYLPEYHDMIERYYEALANLGNTAKDNK